MTKKHYCNIYYAYFDNLNKLFMLNLDKLCKVQIKNTNYLYLHYDASKLFMLEL